MINTIAKNPSQDWGFVAEERYLWIQPDAYHTHYLFSGNIDALRGRLRSKMKFMPVPQLSRYKNSFDTHAGETVNVFHVIREMRSGKMAEITRRIKEAKKNGDDALKAKLKREQLPCFTHTGIFSTRTNDGLIQPAFTFQLDIDGISNADQVLELIIQDKQLTVLFASISTSGGGVKALLFLDSLAFLKDVWTWQEYRQTYHKATDILFNYFQEEYQLEIDTQMKSISQPFYLFHSPNLWVNPNYEKWT